MSTNINQLESRLWGAADELRANSKLKASGYSIPVLGLIFLRYADVKFSEAEKRISEKGGGRRRAAGGKERYQKATRSTSAVMAHLPANNGKKGQQVAEKLSR
jgi:type I restriction enzyme M protein